jgi:hypothetical protein
MPRTAIIMPATITSTTPDSSPLRRLNLFNMWSPARIDSDACGRAVPWRDGRRAVRRRPVVSPPEQAGRVRSTSLGSVELLVLSDLEPGCDAPVSELVCPWSAP